MTIEEYFGTLQQSFVEIWKNHLQTSKYSAHIALNDFYDEIVDCVDGLIEGWMGTHGKVGDLTSTLKTKFDDPIPYLEQLRKFTIDGRKELIPEEETALWSCVDDIIGLIDSTLYKLKELKEDKGMKSLRDYILESLKTNIHESRHDEYSWHGESAYIISGGEDEGTVAILTGGWNDSDIKKASELYNAERPLGKYEDNVVEVEWDEFMKEQ